MKASLIINWLLVTKANKALGAGKETTYYEAQ